MARSNDLENPTCHESSEVSAALVKFKKSNGDSILTFERNLGRLDSTIVELQRFAALLTPWLEPTAQEETDVDKE